MARGGSNGAGSSRNGPSEDTTVMIGVMRDDGSPAAADDSSAAAVDSAATTDSTAATTVRGSATATTATGRPAEGTYHTS